MLTCDYVQPFHHSHFADPNDDSFLSISSLFFFVFSYLTLSSSYALYFCLALPHADRQLLVHHVAYVIN